MKRLNKEEGIGFLVLLGWSLYLFYLLKTGKIIQFIHPKRLFVMWVAEAGLALLTVFQLTKVFKLSNHQTGVKKYVPLSIVLMCGAITLTPYTIVAKADKVTIESVSSAENQMIESSETGTATIDKTSLDELVFDDDNYTKLLYDVQQAPEQYEGKKVKAVGFVYREASFTDTEFVVGRMYMLCCAADAQLIGLMGQWDKAASLEDGQWVSVEGTLATQYYQEDDMKGIIPIIKITELRPIEEPENPYIY